MADNIDDPADAYEALREAVLARRPAVGSGALILTPIMFDQATLLALRSDQYWSGYADAVNEALAGDGSALWRAAERMYLDVDRYAFYRSLCADIRHPWGPDDFDAGQDPLRFAFASEFAPCTQFPAGVVRPAADVQTERPVTLIFASRSDVLGPSRLIAGSPFLQALGTLCITDVVGHTNYADPAARIVMFDFLASGDARC